MSILMSEKRPKGIMKLWLHWYKYFLFIFLKPSIKNQQNGATDIN